MALVSAARLLNDVSTNITGQAFQMMGGLYSVHIWADGPNDDGFGGGNIFFESNVDDATAPDSWVPITNLDGILYQFGTKVNLDWDEVAHGSWIRAIFTGSTGASGVTAEVSRL